MTAIQNFFDFQIPSTGELCGSSAVTVSNIWKEIFQILEK
jgi:hypothetical protein